MVDSLAWKQLTTFTELVDSFPENIDKGVGEHAFAYRHGNILLTSPHLERMDTFTYALTFFPQDSATGGPPGV